MRSVIVGAGTYGEVYLAYLQEAGIHVIGFIDDNSELWGTTIRNIPVLGGFRDLQNLKDLYEIEALYCPIGSNRIRCGILDEARNKGLAIPNFIHPSVILSPNITIGEGVYILPGCVIMPYTQIEDYSMISMGVHIAHHTTLEEGVFLSTGCNVGASMILRRYAYCGISSTIMTGVKEVGQDALIGAGAVVIRDVPSLAVVAGVPAKILKYKENQHKE